MNAVFGALQVALGLLFLASATGKARDIQGFVHGVRSYHVLPAVLVRPYALMLPVLEGGAALLLLSGRHPRVGGALALAMLISFGVGTGVNVWRGRDVPCHCFGTGAGERTSRRSLLRITLLAAASTLVILGDSTDPAFFGSPISALLVTSLGAFALSAGAWLLKLPDLLGMRAG